MCGLYGYIGEDDPLEICLLGLKKLEYRGYDSAGIAGISKGKILSYKEKGKLSSLLKKIPIIKPSFSLAIGHTRWATHGKPSTENAHPHFDSEKTIAVVHNGIIENHSSIRVMLEKKGVIFSSETDAEVIPHLISHYYEGNLLKAVQKAVKKMEGAFAIAVIHKDHPDNFVIASRECPLCVGLSPDYKEVVISSDPNTFLGKSLLVFYLENNEMAKVSRKEALFYDIELNPIEKKANPFSKSDKEPSKEGFEHFMLKEIYDQRTTIPKALNPRILEEFGTAHFEDIGFSPKELLATRHIVLIACGTSWHAGSIGAALLEEIAHIPTHVEIASEFRYKNPIVSEDTLVIAISQSGETADTIAAIREAKAKGAKILGLCNVKNSTLYRESDYCILLNAGPEISVCSTKAFTSQISVLSLFTLYMARLRHLDKIEGQKFIKELKAIPKKIEKILRNTEAIKKMAIKYSKYKNFFFLGRRYMYPTAMEAALKLKEISYLNATAYPAGELKHGPIALIDENLPVIAFCSNKQTIDKIESNLAEVKARGAPVLAFASTNIERLSAVADDIIILPDTIDELATFPSSVAGQLFAYFVAKERNTNIDQPKNLAKSVTVE